MPTSDNAKYISSLPLAPLVSLDVTKLFKPNAEISLGLVSSAIIAVFVCLQLLWLGSSGSSSTTYFRLTWIFAILEVEPCFGTVWQLFNWIAGFSIASSSSDESFVSIKITPTSSLSSAFLLSLELCAVSFGGCEELAFGIRCALFFGFCEDFNFGSVLSRNSFGEATAMVEFEVE